MFKRILVPIGDPTQSEGAVSRAAVIAKAYGGCAYLTGIIQQNADQFADPISWNLAKNQKKQEITRLCADLEAQDISTKLAVLDNFTVENFIRFINEHEFDLIVFSEEDQIIRALMRNILVHTSVPVLNARSSAENTYRRILIPLDGSQRAESILPLITLFAQSMDATLVLAHIIREPEMPRSTALNADDRQLTEQLIERQRQEAERYLTDLRDRIRVPVEIHVTVQNSITTGLQNLINQQNIDLVALCAHGFSGKPDEAFGSITNNLIDYCSTSLLVQQDLPFHLATNEVMKSGRYAGVR